MNKNKYLIPPPLGRLLSALPVYPGSMLFTHGLNRKLSSRLPGDLQELLRNKRIAIRVTDAMLCFHFYWNGSRFAPRAVQGNADLAISAAAHDFLQLATRQEDPDTLFFSRRLVMEGDTELGLAVKNMLDAMETPLFVQEKIMPFNLLRSLTKKIGPRSV